jgi:surface polysaccharide O-acyltransferase-like enzyme
MHDNPIVVDLLMNVLGFVIAIRIGDSLYYKIQKNKGFASSVGLAFLCGFYFVTARFSHMNYYISLRIVHWQSANFYLFWGAVAAISAIYFYIVNKLRP